MKRYWYIKTEIGSKSGWEGGLPPSITKEQWPRHGCSGLPLMHGFTVKVPEEYRTKGKDRIALSYFHPGDSKSFRCERDMIERVGAVFEGGELGEGKKGHPFWEALKTHGRSKHPAVVNYMDILDHDHVIIWHTQQDLNAPRCERPETQLPKGIDGRAMHLDEPVLEEIPLFLTDREPQSRLIQLGWPLHPLQDSLEDLKDMGFGDLSLEIETTVGGANYGEGNCQVDLAGTLLDWACI